MPRPAPQDVPQLQATARRLRRLVVQMLATAGSGHPGGSLSAADLAAALYFHELNHDPANPQWPARDRLVLSKGHGAPILYAALAVAGYFPEGTLQTLRTLGSPLQGHPDSRRCPGVEACTGSLGQGLSVACGIALAARWQRQSYRTYVLMSDGETNEGQTWEAAAFAGFHRLETLTAILDSNKFQLDGAVGDVLSMEPMAEKWRQFGWGVRELDGHDMAQILEGFAWARQAQGPPTMLIAHTVKGKGVSFMESNNYFHGVVPTAEEAAAALKELDGDPALSQALIAAGKIKRGGKS